jgi:hypothetical protein
MPWGEGGVISSVRDRVDGSGGFLGFLNHRRTHLLDCVVGGVNPLPPMGLELRQRDVPWGEGGVVSRRYKYAGVIKDI